MNKKNEDPFWGIVLFGFTILVVVGSVLAILDDKMGSVTAMESAVLKEAYKDKHEPPKADKK